ncbi:OmpA family protein [Nitratireductor sp. XY-223]|uniref:OmpA family protein n=1 Tax=Nitratireductor sp. XY-223 TaxID=2561926 RepID=UPI0010AAB9C3|nr:OmpA family protein [Nitratireductor sp. XY-223]
MFTVPIKSGERSVLALLAVAALAIGWQAPASMASTCGTLPQVLTSTASEQEIKCALKDSQSNSMKRSISIVESEPEVEAVSFAINFEFGSADLTPDARTLLKKIADVIKNDEELSQSAYFIDGHTDAVGSEESNEILGMERAKSAAGQLLAELEFPLTVKVRSFGEVQLLDPDKPNASVNRRVEFTPVSAEPN